MSNNDEAKAWALKINSKNPKDISELLCQTTIGDSQLSCVETRGILGTFEVLSDF